MDQPFLIATAIAVVSLLYATVGQAGGTAFLAVMSVASFPANEMRATALLLNVVAAGYATWRLHRGGALDQKLLFLLAAPALVAAFVGGLIMLDGRVYFILTGLLLLLAGALMICRRTTDSLEIRTLEGLPASLTGAVAGFMSGLTGVGGGVFLTPVLIVFHWASPRQAAAIAPPFILCNSILGLAGVLLAGQRPSPDAAFYAIAGLIGAICGTAIGLRWISDRSTRVILAAILLLAGLRLISR